MIWREKPTLKTHDYKHLLHVCKVRIFFFAIIFSRNNIYRAPSEVTPLSLSYIITILPLCYLLLSRPRFHLVKTDIRLSSSQFCNVLKYYINVTLQKQSGKILIQRERKFNKAFHYEIAFSLDECVSPRLKPQLLSFRTKTFPAAALRNPPGPPEQQHGRRPPTDPYVNIPNKNAPLLFAFISKENIHARYCAENRNATRLISKPYQHSNRAHN